MAGKDPYSDLRRRRRSCRNRSSSGDWATWSVPVPDLFLVLASLKLSSRQPSPTQPSSRPRQPLACMLQHLPSWWEKFPKNQPAQGGPSPEPAMWLMGWHESVARPGLCIESRNAFPSELHRMGISLEGKVRWDMGWRETGCPLQLRMWWQDRFSWPSVMQSRSSCLQSCLSIYLPPLQDTVADALSMWHLLSFHHLSFLSLFLNNFGKKLWTWTIRAWSGIFAAYANNYCLWE